MIDALPIIEVKVEHVDAKLQCSVCWEDFTLGEAVRQLPCTHIYHEPCIRPWLELHGTCPICRQNLITDDQNSGDNNQDSGGNGQDPLNAIRHILQPHQNASSSSSSSSSSTSSTSSYSENSRPTHSRSNNSDSMM